jgi:succinoglycan biosynthesis transport protein ExoP
MKESAPEVLIAAIRRWIPLAAVLVVLGVVAVNLQKQLAGPSYSATARVFLSNTDLGAALTDTQPAYVDPRRALENALALARSPTLYERASDRADGNLPGGRELRDLVAVTGSPDSDLLSITATTDDADQAVEAANTVADEYVEFRSDVAGEPIRRAIFQLRERLAGGPENAEALRQELDQLQLLETLNSGDARVIENAATAAKVSPRPVRDSLLGAAIGLVISLLIAGAREALNTRVRSENDVEAALQRPVLASIATLPRPAGIVTVGRHETRFGDTYALLAANLMQMRGRGEPTVVAVTSAVAGEGKTTTAANLAVALARRGDRVILADFDLRRPAVAGLFRIPADSPGTIEVVREGLGPEAALWSLELSPNGAAAPTEIVALAPKQRPDGGVALSLSILPAGAADRGAQVARSARLADVVDRLAERADVVVLDTPPALLTVEMADLARSVNLVLVVARQGKVTRRDLVSLRRQLDSWQTEIAGAVLTGVPAGQDYGTGYYTS